MAQDTSGKGSGFGWKAGAAITFILMIGGLILAGWVITRFDLWPASEPAATQPRDEKVAAASQAQDGGNGEKDQTGQVAKKVEQLEERLNQIDDKAATPPLYTTPQGSLAAVLRARRSAEQGKPLGFVENQLGIYFGDTHPDAVGAIQAYGRSPVSFSDLSEDLVRRGDAMIGRGGDAPLWDQIKLEFSRVFKLRKRGEPSSNPARILQQAQEALAAGDIEKAIAQVEKLGENDAVQQWLADAQRYMKMEKALDIIEQAALSALPVQPLLVSPIAPTSQQDGAAAPSPANPVQPQFPPIPSLDNNNR